MFDTQLFKEKLNTYWLGHNFYYFEELGSTNTFAKTLSRETSLHGSVILADHQLKGRGQYERNWESTASDNLTFSLVFELSNPERLTILALACALAIADVCNKELSSNAQLKWPNDILADGKKISGILTEAIFNGSILDRVVIGIGININQTSFSDDIKGSTTSFSTISDKKYSREKLLISILSRIENYFRLWSKKDIELVKSINKSLIGYGSWTKICVNGCDKEGEFKFLGINENGALVVLNKELEVDTFSYEQVRIIFD